MIVPLEKTENNVTKGTHWIKMCLQSSNELVGLYIGLQGVIACDVVCSALNMDQMKRRTELSQERRQKKIEQHVKA